MKIMRNLLACLSALLLIVSCSDGKSTLPELFEMKESVALQEVMPDIKQHINSPSCFYIDGDYWVFAEPKMDTLLLVYNTKLGSCQRVLPKGQGYMEAVGVAMLGNGGRKGLVCVYDMLAHSVYKLDLTVPPSDFLLEKDSLPKSYSISYLAYDADLSFYELSTSPYRFMLSSSKGNEMFAKVEEKDGLPASTISKVIQGPCALSRDVKRLAWFSSIGDVYEIYDYAEVDDIRVVCSQTLCFPGIRNDAAITPKEHVGVRSLAVSDKYVYALYVGRTFEEILRGGQKQEGLRSRQLLVFDWEGNPVRLLELDKELFSIAYDEKEDCLYGIGLDENAEYAIYRI